MKSIVKMTAGLLLAIMSMMTMMTVASASPDAPDMPDQLTEVEVADKATAPERPMHSTITAPAYDVCAWVGVRDGVLGFGSASKLVEYYRFWFIDHYWVRCKVKITVSGNVYYHCYIVSTHDGYTIHQGDCDIH